jgi:hypothetical protein
MMRKIMGFVMWGDDYFFLGLEAKEDGNGF